MRAEIKQRIEQLQQGEIPQGYRKTMVGILPVEWLVKSLKMVIKKKNAKNKGGKYNCILTNSAVKGIVPQTDYFDKQIANNEKIEEYYVVETGDFVYNPRISVNAPCGPFNRYYGKETGVMSPLYSVYQYVDASQDYSAFLAFYFLSAYWYRYMNNIANYGARSDRMNVTQEDINFMPLPYPPIREQRKIIEILQTQDRVIALKERYLAEKEKQKKYLMQVLLTGKKRVPGFSGAWKTIRLKDILCERKTYSEKGKEYPLVTMGVDGIVPKSDRYNREHLVKSTDKEYKITHKGDICYNPANLKFGVICENTFGDAIFSPIYVTFEIKAGICKGFLAAFLMRWDFINAVRKYEEGTVYERMAVKPEDFLKYETTLPPYEEQLAIANILSTADREISLLRRDLDEERQKKKALMQLLLTGIVRTV